MRGRGRGRRGRGGRRFDYDDPRFEHGRRQKYVGHKRLRDREDMTQEEKEKTVTDRLKALLVRIGEKSQSSLASNLDMLSKALQVDIAHHRDFIIETLFSCILNLPLKTSIYGTLVGLVNAVDEGFGGEIVKRLQDELQKALDPHQVADNIVKIRLMIRFAACLHNANVILGSDLLRVLRQLISQLAKDIRFHLKEHIVHIVMSTLCWAGEHLKEHHGDYLQQVVNVLGKYMSSRRAPESNRCLRVFHDESNADYLTVMWQGIQSIASSDWEVTSILTPHKEFSRLKKASQHPFKIAQFAEWTRDIAAPPLQYAVHKILDNASKGELEEPDIERAIVSEYMHDLFIFFSSDPKLCCDQIVNLPAEYETKFTVVEAIISHMLVLPRPNTHMVFFGRVIVDLFRRQPKVWPRVLGAAINNIFHKIDKMDLDCAERFAKWFSFHLSNFNYQWPWANWSFVATFPEASPKRVFVRESLLGCQNLSYHDRVKKTIPEELHEMMPPKADISFRYSRLRDESKVTTKGGKSMGELAMELCRMLQQRLSPDDVIDFLALQLAPEDGEFAMLDLFLPCLLYSGRQSYSHTVALIVTYKGVVKEVLLKDPDRSQPRFLDRLFEFWTNSPQHLELIIDKLQAHKFLSSDRIIKWAYQPDRARLHYQPNWSKVVHNALERTLKATQAIDKALVQARIDDEIAREQNDSSDEEEMETEETNETSKRVAMLDKRLTEQKSFEADLFVVLFGELKGAIQALIDKAGEGGNPEQNYLYQVHVGRLTALARFYHRELEPHYDIINELEFGDGEDGQIGCNEKIQAAFRITQHMLGKPRQVET